MTTFTVGFKSWSPQKLSAALLACLFIIETLTFYWTVVRNISPFYPINFDQLSYYFDFTLSLRRVGSVSLTNLFA